MKSLKRLNSALSSSKHQLELLASGDFADGTWKPFKEVLGAQGRWPLRSSTLEIFQINVGYMCNQVCKHCHVDAGPDRSEIMTRETMEYCIAAIQRSGASAVDITGGAPEMNPEFRWFIEQLSKIGLSEIIVRCNLTILRANKKYSDLPEFFAQYGVHVVSSLPYYEVEKTDRQRGDGVFSKSIEALKMLNAVGYGMPDSSLKLDLVYNPSGAFLPNNQKGLEWDFKAALREDHGIYFHQLFAITNMPISRYLEYLVASGNYEDYMDILVHSFNPMSIDRLMCRNTISVSWDGRLYDCDFNQMLELSAAVDAKHISEWSLEKWYNRDIVVDNHCYGCTAGEGSSCQGTLNNA